jgi:hypothetical protein
MTEHNFYYNASFTNAQLPLLKVATLWFDKLVILDPLGVNLDITDEGPTTGIYQGSNPDRRCAVCMNEPSTEYIIEQGNK